MAEERTIQIQDDSGNVYYPQTKSSSVFMGDGKSIDSHLGDATALKTSAKDSFVNAINEVFQSGTNVKSNTISAVNSKGGNLSASATWDDVINAVKAIARGQGNAVESQVLSGADFSNSDGTLRHGAMANNGAVNITPGTADHAILEGYHNGSGKVKGEPNLKAENIPEGMSMFGIAGTLTPIPSLTAGDIVIYDDDSFYNFSGSSSYIKISEKTIKTSGTIRIRFDMKGDVNTAGYYAFGKIYINDIARGTQRSTNALQNWFTEDFTVSKGDKIQLYGNGSRFQNTHIYFEANVNPLFE